MEINRCTNQCIQVIKTGELDIQLSIHSSINNIPHPHLRPFFHVLLHSISLHLLLSFALYQVISVLALVAKKVSEIFTTSCWLVYQHQDWREFLSPNTGTVQTKFSNVNMSYQLHSLYTCTCILARYVHYICGVNVVTINLYLFGMWPWIVRICWVSIQYGEGLA